MSCRMGEYIDYSFDCFFAAEELRLRLVMQSIQFFLSAIVADRSIRILRKRNKAKFAIAWLARPLFIVASFCNLLGGFA